MGVEGADSDAVTAPRALVKRKQIVAVKREAGALHTRFPTHDHKRTRTRDTHDDYWHGDGEIVLYAEKREQVLWLAPRPSLAPSSAIADCDLALGMSLLQIDDALCHWLARHNVTIDFLDDREAWPSQVADVAGLLAMDDGSRPKPSAPEDEARRLEFVNTVCASAREWEKARRGEQFPWTHILAGLMEEVIPDVTT